MREAPRRVRTLLVFGNCGQRPLCPQTPEGPLGLKAQPPLRHSNCLCGLTAIGRNEGAQLQVTFICDTTWGLTFDLYYYQAHEQLQVGLPGQASRRPPTSEVVG